MAISNEVKQKKARFADVVRVGEEVNKLKSDVAEKYALKTAIPTQVGDLTNDQGYQTEAQVTAAINAQVASVYKPGGTKASGDLTEDLLVAANEGKVYNISDGFTTTAKFVEGAGKKHGAGADVSVINAGTEEAPEYKFNVMAGFIDTSGFLTTDDVVTEQEASAAFAELFPEE